MVKGNSKLKRIIKRIREELLSTIIIFKFSGIKDAIVSLYAKVLMQIINKTGIKENKRIIRTLNKKHDIIYNYVNNQLQRYIKEYDFYKKAPKGKNMDNIIWICWWQGIENAPIIVKKCIESIKKNIKEYKIIVITDENYKDYVELPNWLELKKEKGLISKTHFSDILRFKLLAEHGGVWLDSTFFCTSNNIENIINIPVWTIKRPEYGHLSPACGYFANYSFGCKYENREVFYVIYEFLLKYWEDNDFVIDYLLTDYVIKIILNNNSDFKKEFNNIPNNNKDCDELFKVLGKNYDSEVWNNLKSDTCLFKLSWKHVFEKEKKSKKTFYGMLLDGKL